MVGNLLKGILIGVGGIIPGLSGAVIAMIFGLYNKMIYAVGNFFKDIKKNFIFLFPILCGIAIGFILFSNVQKILLEKYPFETMLIIIGLIIGTVPILVKDANIAKFKISYILIFVLTLSIGLWMSYINESTINVQDKVLDLNLHNIINLLLIGFIMAGSHIIPGISGTVILMVLGSYGIMLNAVANLKDLFLITSYINNLDIVFYNIAVIIPIGIGLIIGAVLFSKLMSYFLKRYYTQTYCAIIGFVVGSIPSIVPSMDYSVKTAFGIVLLFISIAVSYKVSTLQF